MSFLRFTIPFVLSVAVTAPPTDAQSLRASAVDALARMAAAADQRLSVSVSPTEGLAIFVSTRSGIPLSAPSSASAEDRALSFLETYGQAFGIDAADQVTVTKVSPSDVVGMEHVRLRQAHSGVPVTAGELIVHLRGATVVAANGEILADLSGVGTTPVLTAPQALAVARERLEKHGGPTDVILSTPRLEILNRSLLEEGEFPTHLTWHIEGRRVDARELLWIDAESGSMVLQFSQLPHARSRFVYDAAFGSSLPGTLVRPEGQGPTGNADIDAAYDYSGDTYEYFLSEHGRDSYDDAGAALVSTVDFCPDIFNCPFPNAFWNGSQMVYGDGFPVADDVDAHELTHAVTEFTAGLFYYMQSGALNESFSDIFGESVDLANSGGTDSAGVRWKIGEDLPFFGAIRDMMTPTIFGDPGKASDTQFVCEDPGGDGGGVHTNSGVPNHAYALMVDGGSYNGFTVNGIGLVKAGKIEYRVLSQYLTSGSGFLDAYVALQQACSDLIGTDGITVADCTQVVNALDAVELWYYWRCSLTQQWQFDRCLGLPVESILFEDDLESGGGNWSVSASPDSVLAWYLGNSFAASGVQHLWGQNLEMVNDNSVFSRSPIVLPNHSYLFFKHSFGFENSPSVYYDGGVLEYSINNGSTWIDGGSLVDVGASYGGTISTCCSNPLAGRNSFVGDSFGYTTTRLDLSSLAGQGVQFRWRTGTDPAVVDLGWFLDDISIYTCQTEAPVLSASSGLIVPGFEVEVDDSTGPTTFFAVRNTSDGQVTIDVDYHGKRVGDEPLRTDVFVLGPQQTLTQDVRSNLSDLEISGELASGVIVITETGGGAAPNLEGDFFRLDAGNAFATGDRLMRPESLCLQQEIRFVDFGSGTEFWILVDQPQGLEVPSFSYTTYNEAGTQIGSDEVFASDHLTTVDVTELGISQSFGTVVFDFTDAGGGFVSAKYSAFGLFSVELGSACRD